MIEQIGDDQWYAVDMLSEGGAWENQRQRLQEQFMQAFLTSGKPHDAALFSGQSIGDRLGATIYFTPGAYRIAASLATHYRAKPCARPTKDTAFLVGDARCRSLLDD